jgi:hypothetical protein
MYGAHMSVHECVYGFDMWNIAANDDHYNNGSNNNDSWLYYNMGTVWTKRGHLHGNKYDTTKLPRFDGLLCERCYRRHDGPTIYVRNECRHARYPSWC